MLDLGFYLGKILASRKMCRSKSLEMAVKCHNLANRIHAETSAATFDVWSYTGNFSISLAADALGILYLLIFIKESPKMLQKFER